MDASPLPNPPRGRGSAINPGNRFEPVAYAPDPGEEPTGSIPTQVFLDTSKSILVEQDSPDLRIERSLNPYRGCEHGCSYCFARPYHEYLSLNSGLDFETKIFAKLDAPDLLRAELSKPRYEPKPIAISTVTDCYQPIERKFRITRQCLEILAECRHPVAMITKNALIERDADLLASLARHRAAGAILSITSLDDKLQRALEPRASTPQARLRAVRTLAAAGVPVGVNIAPVIPGLTDHEIPAILEAAREAGAVRAAWILVRLPHAVKDIFESWLENHAPLRKDRVLNALREMHGGKLYDSTWGKRMRGEGPKAEQIDRLFEISCKRLGFNESEFELSSAAFCKPATAQLELFQ